MPRTGRPRTPHWLLEDDDFKDCHRCGQRKKGRDFKRASKNIDGRRGICRDCTSEATREYRRANPERVRAARRRYSAKASHYNRRYKYGITAEQFDGWVRDQAGRCALCEKPADLVVDHDHSTGAIRGLLCSACNGGLGKLGDSIDGLERAIAYLRREPLMATSDIKKSSTAKDVNVMRQGHTTNGDFGSDPNARILGGRTTRDITIPTAKG